MQMQHLWPRDNSFSMHQSPLSPIIWVHQVCSLKLMKRSACCDAWPFWKWDPAGSGCWSRSAFQYWGTVTHLLMHEASNRRRGCETAGGADAAEGLGARRRPHAQARRCYPDPTFYVTIQTCQHPFNSVAWQLSACCRTAASSCILVCCLGLPMTSSGLLDCW